MDISYLGHSAFKLRGKQATVVTDPYHKEVGFSLPTVSADVVTISHDHFDHNAADLVKGTARRPNPYVIKAPGEYEINGVGVFGWGSYHDGKEGSERGRNTIYSILVDGVRIVHLGDLGHELTDGLIEDLGGVDVLLIPVGGHFTIDAQTAVVVVNQLQPALVVPMHYRTEKHVGFDEVAPIDNFLKEMGVSTIEPQQLLKVTPDLLPQEMQVVLLGQ